MRAADPSRLDPLARKIPIIDRPSPGSTLREKTVGSAASPSASVPQRGIGMLESPEQRETPAFAREAKFEGRARESSPGKIARPAYLLQTTWSTRPFGWSVILEIAFEKCWTSPQGRFILLKIRRTPRARSC
jgi:hypothetical protein